MAERNNEICGNEEWLAAYIDRRLPLSERLFYEKHLSSCPVCLAEFIAATRDLEEISGMMKEYRETESGLQGAGREGRRAGRGILDRILIHRTLSPILSVTSAIFIIIILSLTVLSPDWDPDIRRARLNTALIMEKNYLCQMRLSSGREEPSFNPRTFRGPASAGTDLFRTTKILLRESIGQYPEEVELYNMLGNIYQAENRVEQARTHYQKALRLNPRNPETLNNLAVTSYRLGKDKEAARILHKALSYRNAPSMIYYNLTLLHHHNGDIDRMKENGRLFLQKGPPSSPWSAKVRNLLEKYD